jgi:hypothetical protein
MQYARAFAKHVHRANSRATQAENVCVNDGFGRALQVTRRDLLDEAWDVDVRGASGRARGIETK